MPGSAIALKDPALVCDILFLGSGAASTEQSGLAKNEVVDLYRARAERPAENEKELSSTCDDAFGGICLTSFPYLKH